jgi:hypothetical protein
MHNCLECNEPLTGRIDKKFCNEHCRSYFHTKNKKLKEDSTYLRVNKQLKLNRKILKNVSAPGTSQVNAEILLNLGFKPNYYTNNWSTKNGNLYHFCYEFGFRLLREINKPDKYMLIQWQDYMK